MIGSSLVPRSRWGSAVAVVVGTVARVAVVVLPTMAWLPAVLLRLFIPVALSDVEVMIHLCWLKLIRRGKSN
jgi:hypothetical protein